MKKLGRGKLYVADGSGEGRKSGTVRPKTWHRPWCSERQTLEAAEDKGLAAGSREQRMDRVMRLGAAIANGSYQISAVQLAQKLIEEGFYACDTEGRG